MSRYRLTVRRHFSAAHHLRDYDGKCAHLHGHNYKIEITVTGDELDDCGMLMDFGQLKQICDQVLDQYDHAYLNDLPEFANINATSENIAAHIFRQIACALPDDGVHLDQVKLYETDDSAVTYRED